MYNLFIKEPKKGWKKVGSGNLKMLNNFASNMKKYYINFYGKFEYKLKK